MTNVHLARLKARQDEAKFIRSPEDAKARIAQLQKEIDEEEKRMDAEKQ